jgi:signal transduction histidine kinase
MNEPGDTALRKSGLGFENALGACLLSGIVLYDSKSGTATVSPEARQILGLSSELPSEIPLKNLPAAVGELAREALAGGNAVSARQVTVTTKRGTDSVHVSAVPLKSSSANSAVVLTVHAFSTTTPFIQQIRQLDRLANTGTLAAGMAHEIKNALVAGRTFLDLLLEKNTDAELVQIVRRETGRIDAIVSRMLRFAAPNTTSMISVHLHEVLEHALRLVQPQIAAKAIHLERSFGANPDLTRGDEYELQQAFVNLLLNALEAMSDHGQLRISTSIVSTTNEAAPSLVTMVQDSGAGILPEHMQRLFEPFFTTKSSGTGLGLPITRKIIEEHGGVIEVASRAGQGTTFTVRLPSFPANGGAQLPAGRGAHRKKPQS